MCIYLTQARSDCNYISLVVVGYINYKLVLSSNQLDDVAEMVMAID